VHLVPDFFTADDWKVVADVLGPNPQHLVELHTIQQSQSFIEQVKSNDSVNIEDCIDIYLAYIQVVSLSCILILEHDCFSSSGFPVCW
jgi:hypothetical protein